MGLADGGAPFAARLEATIKMEKIGVSRAVTASHPCNEEAMLVLCCVCPGLSSPVVKSQPVQNQNSVPHAGPACAALRW
jgi:hypothetical protein